MTNLKIRKRSETLYSLYICILVFMCMMEATSLKNFNDSWLHDILQLMALAIALFYIIIKKYTIKELVSTFLLNLVGILCFISSGYSGLLMTMLAITLLPKGSLDEILHMILVEETVVFFFIVIMSQIGVLSNQAFAINKGSYTVLAKTFGFEHPNMLAAQAMSILLLYLCVNRNRVKKKHIAFAFLSAIVIFYFSKGRTSFILGVMAIISIALQKKGKFKKFVFTILPWMYCIVLCMLVGCMFAYANFGEKNPIVIALNDGLFNGRVGLAYRSLVVYPITLFGKGIDTSIWNQWQYYSLDNGQVMVLLEYGIAGFICYFVIIQKTLNQIKKENEIVFAIVISIFLIWSMYEGTMYFIGKNFALLFLGKIQFSSTRRKVLDERYDSHDS